MGSYDILIDISENVNLLQFMYSLVNVNHAFSVVGYWIFGSNYEKSLVLNRELLDMICAQSVGGEKVAEFETLFTAVRYIFLNSVLKEGVVVTYKFNNLFISKISRIEKKEYEIIILRCIYSHARKHQIDAEEGNK